MADQLRLRVVLDMAERVLGELRGGTPTTFRTVARTCQDNHEIRTAFLAVLVLARRNVIDVDQPELFGDIAIKPAMATAASDAFLAGLVTEDGANYA